MNYRLSESNDITHLRIRDDESDAALCVQVMELEDKLLVKVSKDEVSVCFDLDPQAAIQLSIALKRHAMRLLQEVEA